MESGGHGTSQFTPATYAIRVRGVVDPLWADDFGGLRVVSVGGGGAAITVLTGRLPDQAALLGVLNALSNLGFPLLGVERLGPGCGI
ncbi:MAG TPA: hypothetical protein VFU81_11380 [Thermomicrobiales bacterium]|nr:hypothetical protein [Thermomicrobiales bacterium]